MRHSTHGLCHLLGALSLALGAVACSVEYGVGVDAQTPTVCWDLNSNNTSDPEEDVNGDGNWDVADCHGPMGPPGESGPEGLIGPRGPEGAAGVAGLPCWDLDGDGQASPSEDINADGAVTVDDCRGAPGDDGRDGADGRDGVDGRDGADGRDGSDGISCWDLDSDGIGDPFEDVDGDGDWDAADCGGGGGAGADGISCWDVDGDGIDDPDEDTDGDGDWDAADCGGGLLTKDALYEVVGTTGPTSSASCATPEDVVLTGGCEAIGMNCLPVTYTSEPRDNTDPMVAASWYCSANCGTVTARAYCLAVPP